MITPALLNYIQQSLKAGKSKDRIKSELLLAGGWQESEVDAAFATLQTGPYKKSFGSKVASFFLTLFIVVIIIGGLAFAAGKYFGPVVSDIGKNIIAALPLKQNSQPAAITPTPEPIVNTPAVPPVAVQTPTVPTVFLTTPVDTNTPSVPISCAKNDTACLLQAATSCAPATETNSTSSNSSSQATSGKEASTRLYTIVGPQNNQCTFKFTVKSDTNKKFAYKSASCSLSTNDLTTLLNSWSTGDFYSNTNVNLYGQCSGTYFNN